MELELWISSVITNHKFSVSNTGKILNNKRNKILSGSLQSTGYIIITFELDGKMHSEYVHRLILFAFIGPPSDPRMTCDHIDRDKTNNNLKNLRWLLPEGQAANTNDSENKKNSIQYKSLVQYDINGTPVWIWSSRLEAATYYNLDARRICEACSTGNLFCGFYWRNYDNTITYKEEVWFPVTDPNFAGFWVSSHGRVKTNHGHISWGAESNGYKMTKVKINGISTTRKVHCLLMEAFVGPKPSDNHVVNHKDGDKSNNDLYNLEYRTYSGNALHAHETGLHSGKHKPVIQFTLENHPIAIYKGANIAEIRNGDISLSSVLCNITNTCAGYKWKYLNQVYAQDSEEYKFIKQQLKINEVLVYNT